MNFKRNRAIGVKTGMVASDWIQNDGFPNLEISPGNILNFEQR